MNCRCILVNPVQELLRRLQEEMGVCDSVGCWDGEGTAPQAAVPLFSVLLFMGLVYLFAFPTPFLTHKHG